MSAQPTANQGGSYNANVNASVKRGLGNLVKSAAKKAVATTQNFIKETEQEISLINNMEGLLIMATKEFNTFFTSFQDSQGKMVKYNANIDERFKHFCMSFNNAVGIVFVASFNLSLTLGGRYGRGIIMKRLSNGVWSLPFAIEEIEASVGWQMGVTRSKTFYCLKSEQEFENFINRKNVKIGGKGFAAIGNYGLELGGDIKQSKKSNKQFNKQLNEQKEKEIISQQTETETEGVVTEQEGKPSAAVNSNDNNGPTPDNAAPDINTNNGNNNINNNNNEEKENNFSNESVDGTVGNAKGLALGANVNVGTFQLCDKINKKFYTNFNARQLIDINSYTNNQSKNLDSKGNPYNVPANDIKEFLNMYHNLIKILERLIAVDTTKTQKNNQFMDDFFWCADLSSGFD